MLKTSRPRHFFQLTDASYLVVWKFWLQQGLTSAVGWGCFLIRVFSNLKPGPGLDPAPGPEEEGILAHAVEAVVGGQGQLPTAGPGQSLLVGIDHFHLADHGLAL